MSLLVVGSIAFDTIHTPEKSGIEILGGSGTHFTSASSFFTETQVVGVIGDDFDMAQLDFIKNRGADLSGIYKANGKTFRWTGKYHDDMNNRDTLSTKLNVFEHFKPTLPEAFKGTEFIFLANIFPGLQLEVLDQVSKPKFTALDTMNFWIEGAKPILEQVLARVNCVILNDSEAEDFSGERNLFKAAHIVASKGPKTVIIKKGEHGAIMLHDGTFFAIPAFILENVADPTGAGDSFAGGFMGYLAREGEVTPKTLRKAIAYGTTMASFCCEDFGSTRFINLSEEEVNNRFAEFQALITIE